MQCMREGGTHSIQWMMTLCETLECALANIPRPTDVACSRSPQSRALAALMLAMTQNTFVAVQLRFSDKSTHVPRETRPHRSFLRRRPFPDINERVHSHKIHQRKDYTKHLVPLISSVSRSISLSLRIFLAYHRHCRWSVKDKCWSKWAETTICLFLLHLISCRARFNGPWFSDASKKFTQTHTLHTQKHNALC